MLKGNDSNAQNANSRLRGRAVEQRLHRFWRSLPEQGVSIRIVVINALSLHRQVSSVGAHIPAFALVKHSAAQSKKADGEEQLGNRHGIEMYREDSHVQ